MQAALKNFKTLPVAACAHEAFEVLAGNLGSGILLLADHATNHIPNEFNALGLTETDLKRHIAYDIGVDSLVRDMAVHLGVPAVLSRFSRLLIDPNRGADDPTLVMRIADGALIPGNARVDAAGVSARIARFHQPYHATIAGLIDRALAQGIAPAIVSLHSFTPTMRGHSRPWHVGVLWDGDPRLATPLLQRLRSEPDLVIGDNEPYDGALAGDTIDQHATDRGLSNCLVELRQDLIGDTMSAQAWAKRLCQLLLPCFDAPEVGIVKHFKSRTRDRIRPHS